MTNRQPKGTPVGGQFAEGRKPECDSDLIDPLDVAVDAASEFTGSQLAAFAKNDEELVRDDLPSTPLHIVLTPEQDEVATAYKTAALWASTDDDGSPLDSSFSPSDISEESSEAIAHDAVEFWAQAKAEGLVDGVTPEQFGHDFYLTRAGHGTGFWDRGRGANGDRLTEMAKEYGEKSPVVGDDGKIHFE